MCGRYTLARGERVLEVVQNVTMKEDLREVGKLMAGRWNIAPMQDVLVVANWQVGGKYLVEPMRWGLVPFWAKDASIGGRMINARAETLTEKRAFRVCLERRRCVIPADGFYEWQPLVDGRKGKVPMYIRMKDGRAFGFAGLWETWKDAHGVVLKTFTIITTSPNSLVAKFHDRMPVILTAAGVVEWLDPRERDAREMVTVLKPWPADEMEAYAVSPAVNNVRNEGADLILPAVGGKSPPAGSTPRAERDVNQGELF